MMAMFHSEGHRKSSEIERVPGLGWLQLASVGLAGLPE